MDCFCRFLEAHRSIYNAERSRYAGFRENLLQTHRNIMTPDMPKFTKWMKKRKKFVDCVTLAIGPLG